MQSIEMSPAAPINRGARAMLLALLLFPLFALQADENGGSRKQSSIELTKVDLFGSFGWQHKTVAVDGFSLGMEQSAAVKLAQSQALKFVIASPKPTAEQQNSPCVEGECAVYKKGGNWIGLDIFFDGGRVAKIKVSVPADADPEVKKVNVARQFKGQTHQLFNQYSDSLRTRLLGALEARRIPVQVGTNVSNLVNLEYDYRNMGVVVHTTIDTHDSPPQPFDLEVDFVRPQ